MGNIRPIRKDQEIVPSEEEIRSAAVIGYIFVGIFQFLMGLGIGWLIWG